MRYNGRGPYQGFDPERKRAVRAEDGDLVAVGPATAARLERDFPQRFARVDATQELHAPRREDATAADEPAARVTTRKPARPRKAKGGDA